MSSGQTFEAHKYHLPIDFWCFVGSVQLQGCAWSTFQVSFFLLFFSSTFLALSHTVRVSFVVGQNSGPTAKMGHEAVRLSLGHFANRKQLEANYDNEREETCLLGERKRLCLWPSEEKITLDPVRGGIWCEE